MCSIAHSAAKSESQLTLPHKGSVMDMQMFLSISLHWLPEVWTFKLQASDSQAAVLALSCRCRNSSWCFCAGLKALVQQEQPVLLHIHSDFWTGLGNGTGI